MYTETKSKTVKSIVTGAAGFAGCNLVETLLARGHFVYAIVRPGSLHNSRLRGSTNLRLIELDMCDLRSLPQNIYESGDFFSILRGIIQAVMIQMVNT